MQYQIALTKSFKPAGWYANEAAANRREMKLLAELEAGATLKVKSIAKPEKPFNNTVIVWVTLETVPAPVRKQWTICESCGKDRELNADGLCKMRCAKMAKKSHR